MRVLLVVLLSSIALPAFANGTWHGAYIGTGTVVSSCDESSATGNFISTIDWGPFDPGTYFYTSSVKCKTRVR